MMKKTMLFKGKESKKEERMEKKAAGSKSAYARMERAEGKKSTSMRKKG
jgi:hypothetical protein